MVCMLLANDSTEGGWVRYLVGPGENDQPVYRICEVQSEYRDYSGNVLCFI